MPDDYLTDEDDPEKEFYSSLIEDIRRNAGSDLTDMKTAFIEMFSETATDAGDLPNDLEPLIGINHQGNRPYRVDGWVPIDPNTDELTLCITDFSQSEVCENIDKTVSENLFKLPLRFFEMSLLCDGK